MRNFAVLMLALSLVTLQGCSAVSSKIDRRTAGTQVEDDAIETKSTSRIQEKYKDAAQVTITSYNRFVLITGTVASDDIKTNVERIVYSVPNVKKIADEVSVGAFPAASVHRTDSSITRDIKSGIGKSKALHRRRRADPENLPPLRWLDLYLSVRRRDARHRPIDSSQTHRPCRRGSGRRRAVRHQPAQRPRRRRARPSLFEPLHVGGDRGHVVRA